MRPLAALQAISLKAATSKPKPMLPWVQPRAVLEHRASGLQALRWWMRWEPPPALNAEGEAVLHVFPASRSCGWSGSGSVLEHAAGAGLALDRFLHAGDALHLGGVAGLSGSVASCSSAAQPGAPMPSRPVPASRRSPLVSHHLIALFILLSWHLLYPPEVCVLSLVSRLGAAVEYGEASVPAERAQRRSGTRAGKAKK